jgi:hypothetical protein
MNPPSIRSPVAMSEYPVDAAQLGLVEDTKQGLAARGVKRLVAGAAEQANSGAAIRLETSGV